jgi:16S rRNA (adenine1518-N6/adenine1519-N6)-dimethyltransferase
MPVKDMAETPAQVRGLPLRARTEYLLRRFDLQPRKSLGQSFLINEGAARLIAETAAEPGAPLVEVGGGLGALTVPLADSALLLSVVEIDRGAAEALEWLVGEVGNVRVVREDFLKVEWEALRPHPLPPLPAGEGVSEGKLAAVGNLPYQSAGAILQKLWALDSPCERLVVMVQREVAERLRAEPGTKAWGPLSALAALHTEERRVVARLGPESFLPAPKVESTVLLLQRRARLPEGLGDYDSFRAAVRGAFGTRRKNLTNSLRISLHLEPAAVAALLRTARIDGGRRGETLRLEELIGLANALQALPPNPLPEGRGD